uniref:Uncharacterized protein n=1 Tax=Caenorhabditis japonica TaxID=281687 RepID=A0A8R1E0K9_CAEJA
MHEAPPPEIDVRLRQRDWRHGDERRGMPTRRETTQSQYVKHNYSHNSSTNRRNELHGGSLASSSSPMTSSEEGGHSSDPWNTSSISSGKRDIISPPLYSSTPRRYKQEQHQQQQQQTVTSPQPPITKTIEVKVERSEKVEQVSNAPTATSTSSRIQHVAPQATYAQPIIRGQPSYGSRTSSIATSQMRCDQSEIDFSWVNEEEDKLKRENKRTDSLPEFYFGMEPPPVASDSEKENDEEKRRRRKSNVLEKTAAFEIEAKRSDRKEPSFLSRSTHHLSSDIPNPDYSPLSIHTKEMGGPAERRIYRMQKQNNHTSSADDRRYRSSIAF